MKRISACCSLGKAEKLKTETLNGAGGDRATSTKPEGSLSGGEEIKLDGGTTASSRPQSGLGNKDATAGVPPRTNNQELITVEQLAEQLVRLEPASLPHRTLLALVRLKLGKAGQSARSLLRPERPAEHRLAGRARGARRRPRRQRPRRRSQNRSRSDQAGAVAAGGASAPRNAELVGRALRLPPLEGRSA